jgi:hypothetical protein
VRRAESARAGSSRSRSNVQGSFGAGVRAIIGRIREVAITARCTLVDIGCFPYCASAFWANVDISTLPHLSAWIDRLHQRPSFRTGLTIPFARPAFFGPAHATSQQIDAEIARNARQFAIVTKSAAG